MRTTSSSICRTSFELAASRRSGLPDRSCSNKSSSSAMVLHPNPIALSDASCGLVARFVVPPVHLAVVSTVVFEHEQTKGGRQVSAMSAAMNSRHDILHAGVVLGGDLLESLPERIFE